MPTAVMAAVVFANDAAVSAGSSGGVRARAGATEDAGEEGVGTAGASVEGVNALAVCIFTATAGRGVPRALRLWAPVVCAGEGVKVSVGGVKLTWGTVSTTGI